MSLRGQGRSAPNVIVVLADDLGYADLGCFGSAIPTPNIDKMAAEGARLTTFYSADPVCSPSRAALLTGRYPARTNVVNVLMPNDNVGLSSSEVTLPRVMKDRGYRTACVGKWHLGTKPDFMPNRHGFDEYYGVPYSNDMNPLPLIQNTNIVQTTCDQETLTQRWTTAAVDFINRSKDGPFFLYLAQTAPHLPLVPSDDFIGKSGHGVYGDLVMEIDWSVGQILDALKANGIDENTLVIFTSDNGPWYQGSAGNLQGRKGSTYEGGVREPFVARMPGTIPAGTVSGGLSSMMDLLPTIASLTGASVPASTDGVNIWPLLTGTAPFIEREALLFFDGWQIQCVRFNQWKLHVARYNTGPWTLDPPNGRANLPLPRPELYNIDEDPSEAYDVATEKPQVVANLKARVDQLLLKLPDQVRSAWRQTLAQPIQDTPVGAMPRRNID